MKPMGVTFGTSGQCLSPGQGSVAGASCRMRGPLRMVAVPSAHSSEQSWCLEFSQDEKIIGRPWILGFICTYVFKLDDFFITTSGMYSL